jgi:hypothetical protein
VLVAEKCSSHVGHWQREEPREGGGSGTEVVASEPPLVVALSDGSGAGDGPTERGVATKGPTPEDVSGSGCVVTIVSDINHRHRHCNHLGGFVSDLLI